MKRLLHFFSFLLIVLITLAVFVVLVLSSTDFVARNWNPLETLDVNAEVTQVTKFQMRRALASKDACVAAMEDAGVDVRALDDFVDDNDERCGISDRVELRDLGAVKLNPLELNCAAALRLVMWSAHEARPAAREFFGRDIGQVEHFGSYNCREMRTTNGASGRMSKHATARAVDISGFVLQDGTQISIKKDWGHGEAGLFLKRAHARACNWFNVVLGPEYNSLHADHFHMDIGAWRVCR